MKRVQKAYGIDNTNRHLKKEINLLLLGLKIMKKVENAYNRNGNGYLKEEINPFRKKK